MMRNGHGPPTAVHQIGDNFGADNLRDPGGGHLAGLTSVVNISNNLLAGAIAA